MSNLYFIFFFSSVMSLASLVGVVTFFIKQERFDKLISYLIALASGTLLGAAFFHILPHSIESNISFIHIMVLLSCGFTTMYILELFVHWHHCHKHHEHNIKPQGFLILLADGLHNLIDGLGVGASLAMGKSLGTTMWIAALLHEIPQELGDFAVLVDSGWSRKKALLYNFLSSLPFFVGMLIVYFLNQSMDVTFLVPFAAGNFIYIAASDLIPEVKHHEKLQSAAKHLFMFLIGMFTLLIPHLLEEAHHAH